MSGVSQGTSVVKRKIIARLSVHWRTVMSFSLLLILWEGLVRLLGVKLYILQRWCASFSIDGLTSWIPT
jgi:hypothetical protein